MRQQKSVLIASSFFLLLAVVGLSLFLFSGDNVLILKQLFDPSLESDDVQRVLSGLGYKGHITVSLLAMLQVVFAFLPAEPVQVAAGIAFGFPIGILCCMIGVLLGNTLLYVLYKIYAGKLDSYIDEKLGFDFRALSTSKRVTLVVFILYFLPAIPYGLICLTAAAVRMKYPRYIFITLTGSLPSVCIGVGLGHVAIAYSWILALSVFAVLVVLLVILFFQKKRIFAVINRYIEQKKEPYSSKTVVRSYHHFILDVFYVFSRIIFFFKGVKVRYINRAGALQTPAVVLCNHESFVDFAYVGSLIRKYSPNFPVARLYFYRKSVGNFIKRLGCYPKSMFDMDLESVKNSMRVIKNGGVLAMMPEARLSTVGEFEDIQSSTYTFLQKLGVPVYTVKISGAYLAKPKWGDKMRRGAYVEAVLEPLFTAEEISSLKADEIARRVESTLYFNELDWLKSQPKIRYRSRTLAEGLENILSICPKCKEKYTIKTKKRDIFCEKCGKLGSLTDRYLFENAEPFADFAAWYHFAEAELERKIEEDRDFSLSSPVVLKHASMDGKTMLRKAGEGECVLDASGLTYRGSEDGETVEKHFPMEKIYRLLFGAGEDFEIYEGKEIYYFVPEERRMAVDFYIASRLWKGRSEKHP